MANAARDPDGGHTPPAAVGAESPAPPTRRSSRGRLIFWSLVLAATVAVFAGVPAVFVFGPLVAFLILRIGFATFNSLESGADHIPDADPVPVDPRQERTTYWCPGCGAELLLIVRGTPMPPRHCGERMTQRRELARDRPPSLG